MGKWMVDKWMDKWVDACRWMGKLRGGWVDGRTDIFLFLIHCFSLFPSGS